MTDFKYISDPISIDLSTLPEDFKEKYARFEVEIKPSDKRDTLSHTKIYEGRLFVRDEGTLYLNDIIKDHMYPLSHVKVTFYNGDRFQTQYRQNILNINEMVNHRDPIDFNIKEGYIEAAFQGQLVTIDGNFKPIFGEKFIKPSHFPQFKGTGRLHIGCFCLITSNTPFNRFYINTFGITPGRLNGKNYYGELIESDNNYAYADIIMSKELNGEIISDYPDIWDHAGTIHFWYPNTAAAYDFNTYLLGYIDTCPAPYYVNWIDRAGIWRCQPFTKKVTFSEDVKSQTLYNETNTEQVYRKVITNQWDLNSDWMNDNEYFTYESILTSPKILLLDTEKDAVTECVCRTHHWEEKKQKNQRKLFNLNIKLEASNKQIITY